MYHWLKLFFCNQELESDEKENQKGDSKSDWLSSKSGRPDLVRSRSTLVICPASLIGQWEGEIKKRLKSDALRVLVYHGNARGRSAKS